ncbi:MAG: tRNA glutamyl-Q(34) synthetase GluQRS [Oscillospiraceae bacterium]|nr:tRNA glutamyl-Q(34) synthetase GluQRS [Oscillospiraceae bacterium]
MASLTSTLAIKSLCGAFFRKRPVPLVLPKKAVIDIETVGRLAPTPSGRMHLGNVFCALLAWLSARQAGGKVLLRIEDLDQVRAPRRYAGLLEEDFCWLGISWDEGGSRGGPQGPYYQSERSEIYLQCLQKLEKLTYPCFCSRAELHAAEAPHMSDGRFLYTGRCRGLTAAEIAEKRRQRPPAVRIAVPEETIRFDDLRDGPQQALLTKACGDFVIRRADGVFAYQLATAADDALMGVTQVVRGSDLLGSTFQQRWLQKLLGLPSPRYGHIPLLTAPDGRRLSKRDGDLDLGALRQRGVRPERITGLLGYLAGLLEKPEEASPGALIPLFDWAKIPKQEVALTETHCRFLFG